MSTAPGSEDQAVVSAGQVGPLTERARRRLVLTLVGAAALVLTGVVPPLAESHRWELVVPARQAADRPAQAPSAAGAAATSGTTTTLAPPPLAAAPALAAGRVAPAPAPSATTEWSEQGSPPSAEGVDDTGPLSGADPVVVTTLPPGLAAHVGPLPPPFAAPQLDAPPVHAAAPEVPGLGLGLDRGSSDGGEGGSYRVGRRVGGPHGGPDGRVGRPQPSQHR